MRPPMVGPVGDSFLIMAMSMEEVPVLVAVLTPEGARLAMVAFQDLTHVCEEQSAPSTPPMLPFE